MALLSQHLDEALQANNELEAEITERDEKLAELSKELRKATALTDSLGKVLSMPGAKYDELLMAVSKLADAKEENKVLAMQKAAQKKRIEELEEVVSEHDQLIVSLTEEIEAKDNLLSNVAHAAGTVWPTQNLVSKVLSLKRGETNPETDFESFAAYVRKKDELARERMTYKPPKVGILANKVLADTTLL